MELEKVYHAPDGFQVHSAWYDRRLEFKVFVYPDGTERIVVWDNENSVELFNHDLPEKRNDCVDPCKA